MHFISNIYVYKLYGYGSIPINTIFSGMNIHLPVIWGSLGTRVLTHPHICSCPCDMSDSIIRWDPRQNGPLDLMAFVAARGGAAVVESRG